MAGNIAIFEGNGKINITIEDDDGNVIYQLQGMGGQIAIDDADATVLGYLKDLDPSIYGEVTLMTGGAVLNAPSKSPAKEDAPAKPKEKIKDDALPDSTWTKPKLKEYMDANSIEYNSGDTKGDLLDKITSIK
jgi:hypothetical protein